MRVTDVLNYRLYCWQQANVSNYQDHIRWHRRTSVGYLGPLLAAAIFGASSTAFAQGVPCFSAAQCAQIRMQAEQQQAAAADFQARQQQAQAQQAAFARVQAAARAKEAAAANARQAAQDEEALEERQRRQAQFQAEAEARIQAAALLANQVAENRAAAQLAAENAPDNRCHDQKVAGQLLDYFNGLQAAADYNSRAIDIDHLTTLQFDSSHSVMSCHGYFVLQDGRRALGTLSTRLNVAGNVLTTFHSDTN